MATYTRTLLLAAGAVGALVPPVLAQQQTAPVPAAPAGQSQLPPVDVIQKQAPAPAPKRQTAQPKAAPKAAQPVSKLAPKPQPKVKDQTAPPAEPVDDPGAERAPDTGRLTTGAAPGATPVNSDSLLPQSLQNFSSAASRVGQPTIDEQRPVTTHEALASVPGVVTVTDDGLSRHTGIGIRGSNFRRARKVLVLEDGVSINFASYIDPSTHYTPPLDRVENIEIVRGTIFAHGPLTNHGMVNFQNLSPFGKNETVIEGALIHTDDVDQAMGNYRHVHTRQTLGNVGIVAAYSGASASGAWDNERLTFNDFYGAIGWKGVDQDLTISAVYFRQRDRYDEDNFVGTRGDFFANGHRKLSTFGDDTGYNTYNADHRAIQIAHNYYVDDTTTVSTRIYTREHERNRFSARDGGPDEGVGLAGPADDIGHMRGRNRYYAQAGIDSRVEFAGRPFLFGMTQDILAGARYEFQYHRRCTAFGLRNQVLNNNNNGNCFAIDDDAAYEAGVGFNDDSTLEKFAANSFAAFIQSAVHVNRTFTVTPGLRFESYEVERTIVFDGGPDGRVQTSRHDHILPGVMFAWEAMPRTTLYGGYHRGFAPHLSVEAGGNYPLEEEVGDTVQIGLRSTAIRGLTFDIAYFHSFINDYQLKEAYTDAGGADVYGLLDKVEIKGVELGARVDSRPFTGGPLNLFSQVAYTFTDARIKEGQDAIFDGFPIENVAGNRLPFSIRHYANLTIGFDWKRIFDASVTWTYRGAFFTNPQNTVDLLCIDDSGNRDDGCTGALDDPDEMIGGKVGGVWTLSARSNLKVSEQLTLFVSGANLTDELYIADLQDGAKPGQGRTIMGGFTLRFD